MHTHIVSVHLINLPQLQGVTDMGGFGPENKIISFAYHQKPHYDTV